MTKKELKEIKLDEEKERGFVSKDLRVSKTIKFKNEKGFILSTISRDSIETYDTHGAWSENYLLKNNECIKKPELFIDDNKTIVPLSNNVLSQNFSIIFSTSSYSLSEIKNQRKVYTGNKILEFSINNFDSTFISIALQNGTIKEEAIIVWNENIIKLNEKLCNLHKALGIVQYNTNLNV